MPLISRLGAASSRGFGQFTQQVSGKYIEDYFSTYIYKGTDSALTINNGIGLSDTAAWSSFTATQATETEAWDVTVDSSGNFYTAGRANDGSVNAATVVKYNSSGVVQWQRRWYQSGWTPYGFGVTVDSSGNVFVCGGAYDGTRYNGFVIKYNSSGVIQWYRKMFTGQTYLRKVCLDTSGNIYGVGYFQPSADYNIYIVKLDSSGAIVWERRLYENTSFGYGIGIDTSNNIYVTGLAIDDNRQYCLLAKYDSSGVIQWQKKTYEGTYSSSGRSLFVDSSNNVFVGGIAFDGTRTHATIQKFDTSGNRAWSRKYYQNTSYGYGVTADSSGNSYLVGSINSNQQWFVSKYNSSGTIQWQRTLSYTTNSGVANRVAADTTGNIFIAGTFTSPTSGSNVSIVSKILADGSTTSGQAYVTMTLGGGTDAIGGQTVGAGTALDQSSSTTTSTTGATDAAGTLTTATYTQSAVTDGGGMVWLKGRTSVSANNAHVVFDTVRGRASALQTYTTSAAFNSPANTDFVSFNASGFSVGTVSNWNFINSSIDYVSWSWRKAPKFFDVITYTGNGVAGRTVSHNLGSVPGMIIVKCVSSPTPGGDAGNWTVYHRAMAASSPESYFMTLNTTNAYQAGANRWNNTAPTSTNFTVGNSVQVNANGETYVAYLFAHDAGGFGADGSQNVISCGNFTLPSGSGNATVNLGWEPQFVLVKQINGGGNWFMLDSMRGMPTGGGESYIFANSVAAEATSSNFIDLTATGFTAIGASWGADTQHIYLAIRRGPMRTPTSGTSVYTPITYTGNSTANTIISGIDYPPDTIITLNRNQATITGDNYFNTRLTNGWMISNATRAEDTGGQSDISFNSVQNGYSILSTGYINVSTNTMVSYSLRRAPSVHDVVCYTGTGSARTVSHNLNAVPSLMIVKRRDVAADWQVYAGNADQYAVLNSTALPVGSNTDRWNNTAPTSSVFSVGTSTTVNASGGTYIAYLFADCPGVVKVGTYVGNGGSLQIDCGFTSGARFILVKRFSGGVGPWYVLDSARGIVVGNDPYSLLNSNAAEVTNTSLITPYAAGFQVNSTISNNGNTYLFLAIA